MDTPAHTDEMLITAYGYDSQSLSVESMSHDISHLPAFLEKWKVVWIRIVRPEKNKALLEQLFRSLRISEKQTEHLLDPTHMAHVTFFSSGMIKASHMIYYDYEYIEKQMTFFLSQKFLISVHNELSTGIEEVAMMLGNKDLPIRQGNSDLLLYHLLSVCVDTYLRKARHVGDGVDMLEDNLAVNPDDFDMATFFGLRKKLTAAKRDLWLQRDVLSQIATIGQTGNQSVIQKDNIVLFQHCADRASEILELMDTYIDHYRGLLDVYFSSTSNQINQVMKILTIFSAVFLPLSFLVGLWGMNFDYSVSHWNMPELHTRYGYPTALLIMLGMITTLLTIFHRVGWIRFAKKKNTINVMADAFKIPHE